MPVTNSTSGPVSGSVYLPPSSHNQPPAKSPLPRSNWEKSFLNVGRAENSCFSYISQCFRRFAQWIRELLQGFFGTDRIEPELVTIKQVTPEQLEERIQMGREWVKNAVGSVIAKESIVSWRGKSVIEISYKGMTTFSYPTSYPAERGQLKNDLMAKLERLVRSPQNAEDNSTEGARLSVKTHSFNRFMRLDGTVSPISHKIECSFRDFISGSHGYYGPTLDRIEDDQLRGWLDRSLLPQSAADRENIINYVVGVLNS